MGTYDTLGGAPRHDPAADMEYPCDVCGIAADDCHCPECKVCGVTGDPKCYEQHGLKSFWDEWRGSLDGRPTFWLKRLLYLPVWRKTGKWLACRVDLHKFIGADDDGCFHSHPAWAIRIVLWGGYVEEIYEEGRWGIYKTWFPGMVGLVKPSFAHRIQGLVNGRASYSLWLRGPVVADVQLLGNGWPADAQTQNSKT